MERGERGKDKEAERERDCTEREKREKERGGGGGKQREERRGGGGGGGREEEEKEEEEEVFFKRAYSFRHFRFCFYMPSSNVNRAREMGLKESFKIKNVTLYRKIRNHHATIYSEFHFSSSMKLLSFSMQKKAKRVLKAERYLKGKS